MNRKFGYYIALVIYSGYIVFLLATAPLRSEVSGGNLFAWMFLLSYLCGIGFITIMFRKIKDRSAFKRAARTLFQIALAAGMFISLPLPGTKTFVSATPSDYDSSDVKGDIQAPNLSERRAYLLDVFAGRTYKDSQRGERSIEIVDDSAKSSALDEQFADLLELPYQVPIDFYQNSKQDPSDLHGLMKLLAQWTKYSGIDATQGQKVMGIGSVSATGEISAVDQVELYTKAAAKAKPDVFFVPVDSYQQAKKAAPNLLIIPVSRFEEVLYFLDQPVEFWALGNLGLLCH